MKFDATFDRGFGIFIILSARFYRNRVIDTQANIILLHDYRLFVPRLFYLWKRFVNVIFIRQYEYAKHTNRTQKVTTYELATVPYPLPITKIFVTKNIDFWQNGRFRRGGKLILDKTKNMNGQPMRAVVLRHTPGVSFSTGDSNETNFFGLEIEVWRNVVFWRDNKVMSNFLS